MPVIAQVFAQGGAPVISQILMPVIAQVLAALFPRRSFILVYHMVRFRLLARVSALSGSPEDLHSYVVTLFRGVDFTNVSASAPEAAANADEVDVDQQAGIAVLPSAELSGGAALIAAVQNFVDDERARCLEPMLPSARAEEVAGGTDARPEAFGPDQFVVE